MSIELNNSTFLQKFQAPLDNIMDKFLESHENKVFVYVCMRILVDFSSDITECSHVCKSKEDAEAWVAQAPTHGWEIRRAIVKELK